MPKSERNKNNIKVSPLIVLVAAEMWTSDACSVFHVEDECQVFNNTVGQVL